MKWSRQEIAFKLETIHAYCVTGMVFLLSVTILIPYSCFRDYIRKIRVCLCVLEHLIWQDKKDRLEKIKQEIKGNQ
ncbi:MAG: hypothetical protein AB1454_04110 [Candidatus Auribacterota bacterium]